jgi:diguanylate cyclase (GGDEF)-like protein
MLILDWVMPGMDGLEICRRVRRESHPIHPYIILLTGKGQRQDLVEGFEAGADDYVTKPFDPAELSARIRAGERILTLQTESAVAIDSLRKQATHDGLTGLRNRDAILEELRREFGRSPRTGQPVAVVMGDIDRFKLVNDTYGHEAGDRVLAEAAKRMASEVRSYEAVGRYGGEEFLVVLSGCNLAGAEQMAGRLCSCVASKPYQIPGQTISITASFGVASTCQFASPTEELLIRAADAALYRAKHEGRNRVCSAASIPAGGTDATRVAGAAGETAPAKTG